MPHRNINPRDFDDILRSMGDDPAILQQEQSPFLNRPNHARPQLKSSEPLPNPLANSLPHFHKQELENQNLPNTNEEYLFLIIRKYRIFLIAFYLPVVLGIAYIGHQINLPANSSAPEVDALAKKLNDVQEQLHLQNEEAQDYQEELLELIEGYLQKHASQKNASAQVNSNFKLKPSDPVELEIKSWRYLGMANNANGQFAIVHDGIQSFMISLGKPAKGNWIVSDIKPQQLQIMGPDKKIITLQIQYQD